MPFLLSEPSYKSLYVETIAQGGADLSEATAFLAQVGGGTPFLVTNRHVVTGIHQESGIALSKTLGIPGALRVWFSSTADRGYREKVEIPLFDGDEPVWIEHPTLGARADVVALRLPAGRSDLLIEPYAVKQVESGSLEPAQMVSVVGFPFGERTGMGFAVWATGFVATEPDFDHGGRPVFLIDCRSRPGQSGSPVVLHHGYHAKSANSIGFVPWSELLGVYSGRINDESDLGIVWKAHLLQELLWYAESLPPPAHHATA